MPFVLETIQTYKDAEVNSDSEISSDIDQIRRKLHYQDISYILTE
jgi:hypothetical protein